MQVEPPPQLSLWNRLRARAEVLQSPGMLALIILLLLAGFYALEYQRYRAYDIDNPWFVSFTYNDFVAHIQTDALEHIRFPDGMDGTHIFGKAAAFIQWIVLSRFGWQLLPATIVSIVFTLASLALWWAALRKWQLSLHLAVPFLLMVGVSEPVLAMAERCRYDFFCFFLLSLALWMAASRRVFLALLVAFFAVETQPMAILAPYIVMAFLFPRVPSRRRLLWQSAAAAILAFIAYLLLHPHGISSMQAALAQHIHYDRNSASPLWAYFVDRPRHTPELIAFLAGALCFWKHRRAIQFPGLAAAAFGSLLLMGLTPHRYPAYMFFLGPLLYLIALLGFDRAPRWRWILYCAFFIGLAQDGYVYHLNLHEGNRTSDMQRVSAMITQAEQNLHINDSTAQFVGDADFWFAHPAHYSARLSDPAVRGDFYLCYTGHPERKISLDSGRYTCQMLEARLPLKIVSILTLSSGHPVYLLANRN